MGASGWHYFTDYTPDLQVALDLLRQRVFRSGKYFLPDVDQVEDQPSALQLVLPDDFEDIYIQGYKSFLEDFYLTRPELAITADITGCVKEAHTLLGYAIRNAKKVTPENANKILTAYTMIKKDNKNFKEFNLEMILIEALFGDDVQLSSSGKRRKPQSIEEALDIALESGTHSILDVSRISSNPEDFAIAPLSDEESLNVFGTTKPTLNRAKQNVKRILDTCPRWQGRLAIIYKKQTPDKLLFAGKSGD